MRALTPSGRLFLPAGAAILATALVLAAAACGSGNSAGTTTTEAAGSTSTEQWAGGVCTALSTWQTSLQSITTRLQSQHSSSDLKHAANKFSDATETLARSLKSLGKPDTAAGAEAKKELDSLATTLSHSKDKIQAALATTSSGNGAQALANLSKAGAELATMSQNVSQAVTNLKQLDAKGELEQAFKKAPSCSAFVKS